MKPATLIIGSKNVSSWSLRPWLFMKHHRLAFDEVVVPLNLPDSRARILKHSPSGRVPALKHGAVLVWESLAICEYVAETFGVPLAWPLDPAARALARSAAAEMHAGFADLRKEMPFEPTRKPAPFKPSARCAADIGRVRQIWRGCRREHGKGGEWLFGPFGIVDAMFAPVALRFHSYGVPLDGPERDYVYAMLIHPAINEWIDAAATESPPVPSLAGRMQQRAAERTQETAGKTGDAPDITEPVKTRPLATLRAEPRAAPTARPEPPPLPARPPHPDDLPIDATAELSPDLGMTLPPFEEPAPEPHRSELILPSVPIVTLRRAPERSEPVPPKPAPAATKAPEPGGKTEEKAAEPAVDETQPQRLKSFILPP